MPRLDDLASATAASRTSSRARRIARSPAPPCSRRHTSALVPIVDALAEGADVVITGRVADAALFLAPLVHEHGWAWDDWDRLAAGTLVGHLLECSGQSAGGNLSRDWWTVPRPWDLPYPIGEVEADGDGDDHEAGGVGRAGQLRHGAPPAPLRGARPGGVSQPRRRRGLHERRVRRRGQRPGAGHRRAGSTGDGDVQGAARPPRGLGGGGHVSRSPGRTRAEKATATAAIFAERVRQAGLPSRSGASSSGVSNALGGPTVPPTTAEPPEVVLRAAWRCDDPRTAALVGRELVPLTLSGPAAGMTGMGPGRRGPERAARPVADPGRQGPRRPAGQDRGRGGAMRRGGCMTWAAATASGDKGDISNIALVHRR